MREELEKSFFKFVSSEASGGECALESEYDAHERWRKALSHFLLVVCGRQHREDRCEQTIMNPVTDGIDWRNSRARSTWLPEHLASWP